MVVVDRQMIRAKICQDELKKKGRKICSAKNGLKSWNVKKKGLMNIPCFFYRGV